MYIYIMFFKFLKQSVLNESLDIMINYAVRDFKYHVRHIKQVIQIFH